MLEFSSLLRDVPDTHRIPRVLMVKTYFLFSGRISSCIDEKSAKSVLRGLISL